MKRLFGILLTFVVSMSLCGCSGASNEENRSEMYIEVAQLTEEEKDIADLLGANVDQLILDFFVDDTVQRLQVNTYELVDGEWALISGGGGQAFSDAEGRIALGFDCLAEGLRTAIQSEHSSGSTTHEKVPDENISKMGYATAMLSNKTEIIYEEEIPLVIQIITSKNEIHSYGVEYFEHPEEYEKYDYEYVYAITICFSQTPLS